MSNGVADVLQIREARPDVVMAEVRPGGARGLEPPGLGLEEDARLAVDGAPPPRRLWRGRLAWRRLEICAPTALPYVGARDAQNGGAIPGPLGRRRWGAASGRPLCSPP
jgi:hypothetical protein